MTVSEYSQRQFSLGSFQSTSSTTKQASPFSVSQTTPEFYWRRLDKALFIEVNESYSRTWWRDYSGVEVFLPLCSWDRAGSAPLWPKTKYQKQGCSEDWGWGDMPLSPLKPAPCNLLHMRNSSLSSYSYKLQKKKDEIQWNITEKLS